MKLGQKGQGVMEYALILVLVVVVVIVVATLFMSPRSSSATTATKTATPSAREYTTVDKENHLICTHWEYGSSVAGSCVFVPADEWESLGY